MNSQIRGTTTELLGILAFQKRGFYCSIPFDGSCRYDFVVDINGKLLRIQSKSSSEYRDGSIAFSTSRQTTNTQRTVRYKYSEEDIDYFYSHYNGHDFLVPVSETGSGSKILRISKPKKGQNSSINVATDYLLDNVLDSILNDTPIKKFFDSYIVSENIETGEVLEWSEEKIEQVYGKRLRYIKECCRMGKNGYGCKWREKEFPTL